MQLKEIGYEVRDWVHFTQESIQRWFCIGQEHF